tara:strand:- start:973 stop:1236 length:264 start_codon:yes stop_codon:yes gene_type:complete
MKNLNALIKSLKQKAKSDWAIREDMSSMYIQDANDATTVGKLLKSNIDEAAKFISLLDTSIREGIVIAVAKDMGNDWVMENLGWEVR